MVNLDKFLWSVRGELSVLAGPDLLLYLAIGYMGVKPVKTHQIMYL